MRLVPFVRIATADARQIRSGALRPPLERMVIHALGGEAVMAIAFDLVGLLDRLEEMRAQRKPLTCSRTMFGAYSIT